MKGLALGFLCALALAMAPACGGDDDGDGDTADTADVDSGGGGFDATAFCTQYGTVCGFADWYDSQENCVTTVTAWATTRQACVAEHLGFASDAEDGSADEMMHCGHAGGEAPCN